MMDAPLWQHVVAGLAALGAVVWLVRRAFRPAARKGPCAKCAAMAVRQPASRTGKRAALRIGGPGGC